MFEHWGVPEKIVKILKIWPTAKFKYELVRWQWVGLVFMVYVQLHDNGPWMLAHEEQEQNHGM